MFNKIAAREKGCSAGLYSNWLVTLQLPMLSARSSRNNLTVVFLLINRINVLCVIFGSGLWDGMRD